MRALDEILKVKSKTISARYEACKSEADGKGIKFFGMDDKRCWIGKSADSPYDKYGTSGLCKKTKKGIYYGQSQDETIRVYMTDVEGNKARQFDDEYTLKTMFLCIVVNGLSYTWLGYKYVTVIPTGGRH